MEEETTQARKKFPTLPPNFVSLQMLKERREREQKQREGEEEQRRLEEEEKERLRKEDEARGLRNRAEIGAKASAKRYNRKNQRNPKKQQEDAKLKRLNRGLEISVDVSVSGDSELKRFNQDSKIAVAVAEPAEIVRFVPDLKQNREDDNRRPRRRRRYDSRKNKKKENNESKSEEIANCDLALFSAREDDRHVQIQSIGSTETTDHQVKTKMIKSSSETASRSIQAPEVVQRVAMISIVDDDRKADDKKHAKIEAKAERSTMGVPNARPGSTRRGPPQAQRQTAEIEPRIDNRTADDDPNKSRTNQRRSDSGAVMNGGRWDHGSSRKFGRRSESANLVWVKKE